MHRVFKKLLPLLAAAAVVPSALAFSLAGDKAGTPWMTDAYGYDDRPDDMAGVGPMQLNAFYRWNITNLTYAFDQSFLAYFGARGAQAVDQAFAVLNNLPPASQIKLDEYATGTKLVNLQAVQTGLLDVKSYALSMVFKYLGLANPERYVWNLYNVTGQRYYVVPRNYDPYTLAASPYVNGVLYTYRILPTAIPGFDAVEVPITLDNNLAFSSVAGGLLTAGQFFTGLTRDDVGGIKYILSTNTLGIEGLFPGATTAGVGFGQLGGWIGWGGNNAGSNTYTLNSNQLFFISQGQFAAITNGSNFIVQGIRGGMEHMSFTKVHFIDEPHGTLFAPQTNVWQDNLIVTNRLVTQYAQRVITQPDILFVADDLGVDANGDPILVQQSAIAFQNNDAANGSTVEGGPGIITGALQIRISFNRQLPMLVNRDPYFLDEQSSVGTLRWASFDNTPTPPVIYPVDPRTGGYLTTIDKLLEAFGTLTNSISQ